MTTHAEPTVLDVDERSRFEIHVDGRLGGFAQYRVEDPGLIVFTHTEIDDAFEGRGLGSILVRAALDAARARGLAVRPDCPFVRAYIARHPGDYLDLVPDDLRPRLGL
jgi:predicted GNAT family acetyltransferase